MGTDAQMDGMAFVGEIDGPDFKITPVLSAKQLRRKLLRESAFVLFFIFAMGFNLGLVLGASR